MRNISCEFNNAFESAGILSVTEVDVRDVCCLQTRFKVHMDTQTPCNTSECPVGSHRLRWTAGREAKEQSSVEFSDVAASLRQASGLKSSGIFPSLSFFFPEKAHLCAPNYTTAKTLLGRWCDQMEWWWLWRGIWAWTHTLPLISSVNKVRDEFSMSLSIRICKMEMRIAP